MICDKCGKQAFALKSNPSQYEGAWCEDCLGYRIKAREWTTEAIRQGRKQYRKELLQPFRGGEVSKEYLDAYPHAKKGMIKEGIITKKQARNAKEVWKGVV